jgi:hypothetical protein
MTDPISKADAEIEALKKRLHEAKLRKAKAEARQRATEAKKKRADDTRRKILVGAAILARVESGKWPKDKMTEMMGEVLTRADDRALFELPPLAEKKE